MSRVAAVLLAAGASARMGQPKQLLQFEGESLVRRAALAALASRCDALFVVVGDAGSEVREELAGLELEIAEARDWREGLSGSIRAGIEAVSASDRGPFDALLLLLADQPRVTTPHIDRIARAFTNLGRSAVASQYAGTIGVPALFGSEHYEALRQLEGDRGAKALLVDLGQQILQIPLPEAAFDVDTTADLEGS